MTSTLCYPLKALLYFWHFTFTFISMLKYNFESQANAELKGQIALEQRMYLCGSSLKIVLVVPTSRHSCPCVVCFPEWRLDGVGSF